MKSQKQLFPFSRMLFAGAIISSFLFSCRDRGPVDGGPCAYQVNKLPATIIAIEKHDSISSEILFEVETAGKKDTLYYTRNFPGWATNDDIAKYDLKLGNRFVYEEHEITKGTCNPLYYRLTLVKFK
jgi:hypothetical protein